jgi:hypothetical protein
MDMLDSDSENDSDYRLSEDEGNKGKENNRNLKRKSNVIEDIKKQTLEKNIDNIWESMKSEDNIYLSSVLEKSVTYSFSNKKRKRNYDDFFVTFTHIFGSKEARRFYKDFPGFSKDILDRESLGDDYPRNKKTKTASLGKTTMSSNNGREMEREADSIKAKALECARKVKKRTRVSEVMKFAGQNVM